MTPFPTNSGESRPASDLIRVRDLTKTYAGGDPSRPALDRVSIDIPRRHFVSLIGPSGCGKSTLLRVIAGLEGYDSGEATVFGTSPKAMCANKAVGLVPQTPALLPWKNVRRNIALPQKVNRRAGRGGEDPDDLLRMVGLGELGHRYPHELSGGQQQRVAIARAFGMRPEVLLMDEPFSALDEFTRESLQLQLLAMWERMATTVVFVTHSVREAVTLSDEIVVMSARPGRIHEVLPVDLPRPRDTALVNSPRMHAMEDRVRASLESAWQAGAAPDDLVAL
ncbi:ABC transporter ATP-binding protein [Nocardiopsis algeriensis]|uniref:NitT/TauT family transport system ATP-binding protein n=1 Tax=Nocardiopsis algeriensis TaxID=1478215 RepID=A0A841IUL6_9ACTN|nr:ABC transporter ATP-binding protein [Nocardiopsis algeriensis]MBB6121872.1 NitT/TauT family transport system ATP-binding protein [Nocardiopsis algeriensis]